MKRKNCSPLRMADGGVIPARHIGYTGSVAPALAAAPEASASAVIQRRGVAALRDGAAFLEGPGGPTDDKIPAKLSRGEAVLPADTVDALGPHNVQALIDATHTPVKPKGLRHFANGIAGVDVVESPFTESDARLFNTRPAGTTAAAPSMPGVDVSERPMAGAAEARGFAADPGPGNPRVGPTGSPERAAFQSSRPGFGPPEPTTTAVSTAPTTTAAPPSAGYRAGNLAARGLRATIPALVGGEIASNLGDHKISDDLDPVDSSAAGTFNYLRNGDFGNAWNSVKKGAVEAGMDLATGAAGVGDVLLPGTPLTDAVNNRFKQDLGPGVQTPKQPAPRDAGGGRGFVNPAAASPSTDVQRGSTAPVTAPPLDNSVLPGVQRRGNSFTNTGRFVEDERPGAGPNAQNSAAADALVARSTAQGRAGLRGGMDDNLPAGYGATIPGLNAPASQAEAQLAARNASVRSTLADRDTSLRTRIAQQEADTHARAVDMQDATTRRGQDVNADTARMHNTATLRGQDLTYGAATRGQDMTARTAANAARLQQMNTDRQYNLDVSKFGEEKAKTMFSQREQADKDLTSKLESMHTTVDGKGNQTIDREGVASSKAAINSYLGSTISNLENVPQSSPDYQRSQQLAQQLREHGAAAIGEDRLQKILTQQEVQRRAAGARGYGPFSGKYVDSADPSGYDVVGRENGLLQDQYVMRNGSKVPTRTLDYDQGGNAILPNFIGNNRTDRFNTVKKGDLRNGF